MPGAIFIYGTLRHEPLLKNLVPGTLDIVPAVLEDYELVSWPDAHLPWPRPKAGGRVEGLLLNDVSDVQRRALEAYEQPFNYHPVPVIVALNSGALYPADSFFPGPEVSGSDVPWSLDIWLERHGAVSMAASRELAAHDPALTAEELGRQWHMISSRANSRIRAKASLAPATVRYNPKPEDFNVVNDVALSGGFFKLSAIRTQYRKFDGTSSDFLMREALVGVDAALLLPYDKVRDRVLLVEQFRAGPARRGDPNPWSLEPVAGMIDPGEDPKDAAVREAHEEANLEITEVTKMFQMYPSPGSNTDHFYCYYGEADLPSLDVSHGGLEDEHEDLRLHVMSLDDALALIDTGEVQAGPLVAMLLWLQRHRDQGKTA